MRKLLVAMLLCGGACTYDLDPLYESAELEDDKAAADEADAAAMPGDDIDDLASLWAELSDTCASCAADRCAEVNTACLQDPECTEVTRCFAEETNPAAHAACREAHRDWFAADMGQRGIGGPMYDCMFRHSCAQECGAPTDWSCVQQFDWPTTQQATVTHNLEFVDALSNSPATGLTVKVCRPEDVNCEAPTMVVETDEAGRVDLELPTRPLGSFQGFLELTGEGWAPTIMAFGWPAAQSNAAQLRIVNEQSYNFNLSITGEAPDPNRGLLQLRMFGCAGVGMEGVRFESAQADEYSRVWYYDGKFPSFDAEGTLPDGNGNGGMTNLPAGLNQITATRVDDDSVVAEASVPVRPEWLSIVILAPIDSASR